MEKFGIGRPVRRKEDARLLTGRGTYTDDIDRPGQAHAFVLRSPHAHARILSIDTGAARAAPGVVAVPTGRDADEDGIGRSPVMVEVPGKDGEALWPTPWGMLQTIKVRFIGDPVAPVVAEARQHAQDAAELVEAGLGQALLEHAVHDRDSGQLLSATFQDYRLARAADAPSFVLGFDVVPCPNNDLGVKGAGEGGTCGAPPAVVSAVCDALGVAHIDMPLTPERVWRALAA